MPRDLSQVKLSRDERRVLAALLAGGRLYFKRPAPGFPLRYWTTQPDTPGEFELDSATLGRLLLRRAIAADFKASLGILTGDYRITDHGRALADGTVHIAPPEPEPTLFAADEPALQPVKKARRRTGMDAA